MGLSALTPFIPIEYSLPVLAACLVGILSEILDFKRDKGGGAS